MGEITTFDSPVLSVEREDTVATVWLDRPEARNAMGEALWRDLPRAMEAVSTDAEVRVVVLAAKGPHFSVGLDLKAMGEMLIGGASGPPTEQSDAGRLSLAERGRRARLNILHLQDAITAV